MKKTTIAIILGTISILIYLGISGYHFALDSIGLGVFCGILAIIDLITLTRVLEY